VPRSIAWPRLGRFRTNMNNFSRAQLERRVYYKKLLAVVNELVLFLETAGGRKVEILDKLSIFNGPSQVTMPLWFSIWGRIICSHYLSRCRVNPSLLYDCSQPRLFRRVTLGVQVIFIVKIDERDVRSYFCHECLCAILFCLDSVNNPQGDALSHFAIKPLW
jgi:hypothetical protein